MFSEAALSIGRPLFRVDFPISRRSPDFWWTYARNDSSSGIQCSCKTGPGKTCPQFQLSARNSSRTCESAIMDCLRSSISGWFTQGLTLSVLSSHRLCSSTFLGSCSWLGLLCLTSIPRLFEPIFRPGERSMDLTQIQHRFSKRRNLAFWAQPLLIPHGHSFVE